METTFIELTIKKGESIVINKRAILCLTPYKTGGTFVDFCVANKTLGYNSVIVSEEYGDVCKMLGLNTK